MSCTGWRPRRRPLTRLSLLWAVALLLAPGALAAPAQAAGPAAKAESAAPDAGEKLPAQLPSVTVQGQDQNPARVGDGTKLLPSAGLNGARVRLPEPFPKRATTDGNRALMVNVTPSTLEATVPLDATSLPFTSLLGGYGPIAQYRAGLYDARLWGPALGITQIDGRAGWGWSDWAGKEWLDWSGVGRLTLEGTGFGWQLDTLRGGQAFFHGAFEHGESEDFLVGADGQQGMLTSGNSNPLGAPALVTSTAGVHASARLAPMGDHRLGLKALGQARRWGTQAGPEGYAALTDTWSLSEAVQLESSLGGGYYGFEPIVDPDVAFHFRPDTLTHLMVRLRTASELPNFATLYLDHQAISANGALQAERVEGWAELAATRRLNEAWWASAGAGLRRSYRHIFWQADPDPAARGLWRPVNASDLQWGPQGHARLAYQWLPNLTQDLTYGFEGAYPLGFNEHRVGTSIDGSLLDKRLTVGLGVEARRVSLAEAQSPGGGTGYGVFAEAGIEYALVRDLFVGLRAGEVPLTLVQPALNYFVPTPILTATARYQF